MPSRRQVLSLVESGLSYEDAATRLGIDAGLAYLVATGLPADGGDTLTTADRDRPGFVETSTQHLSNPQPADNPATNPHILEWIKQRARSDAQMLDAAAERDARPAQPHDPDDERDLITVLTRDHDRVTALLEQLSTIPGHADGGSSADIQRRESIVDMVAAALSRHESVEEEYLWPAVREALPDGDARVDEALRQEQEATETLAALAKGNPDSDEFDELVERLALQARRHVAFEDRVFLDLQSTMPDDERRKLGRKLQAAKAAAPTRPHPRAPRKPAAAVKAAGAPAAAADKVRDAAGRRPAARHGKAPGEAEDKRAQAAKARHRKGRS